VHGRRGSDPGSERRPSFTDTQPWENGVGLLAFKIIILGGSYGWAVLVEDRLPDWAVLTGIFVWIGVALVLFKLGPYWWWAWRDRRGRRARRVPIARRGRHALVPAQARTDRDEADRRDRDDADRRDHDEAVERELERLRRVHALAMGENDLGRSRDPRRDPGDQRDGG
jgi:hypothetical protein